MFANTDHEKEGKLKIKLKIKHWLALGGLILLIGLILLVVMEFKRIEATKFTGEGVVEGIRTVYVENTGFISIVSFTDYLIINSNQYEMPRGLQLFVDKGDTVTFEGQEGRITKLEVIKEGNIEEETNNQN